MRRKCTSKGPVQLQRFVDPSSLGFFALGIAFLVRIPNVIRVRTARLTWLATGVGALALLYCGTLIPIPVLDGWLGGTNYLSLLQNVSATLAFWLVMQAVITQGRFPLRQLFKWPLYVGIAAFVVPFFFIDRGTTSQDFMFERADQLPTFLYSSIYLAMIAGICVYLSAKVWKGGSLTFAALLIGAQFVILGSLLQIMGLGGICFHWFTDPANTFLYDIGVMSMSGGVVCMAANMAGIALMRVRRGLMRV